MPKVSLTKVLGNSFFCNGIFAIGVYIQDNKAILIDSGSDEKSAKDALEAVQEAGYEIGAIINTHCHPDHSGGNSFFQKLYPSLKIFCTEPEKRSIEDPSVAPRCFCGGAAPFGGLQNKHIAPQYHSIITDIITPYQDQTISIMGATFKIITLEGHTAGMIGIITPDNVLYSGDALFGEDTLTKHPILFYTDIQKTLETFHKLASLSVHTCVMYHGGATQNLGLVVKRHQEIIVQTEEKLLLLLEHNPLSIDILTQQVMLMHTISNNIIAFTLTQTTVRAYLSYLEKQKKIIIIVKDGLLQASKI